MMQSRIVDRRERASWARDQVKKRKNPVVSHRCQVRWARLAGGQEGCYFPRLLLARPRLKSLLSRWLGHNAGYEKAKSSRQSQRNHPLIDLLEQQCLRLGVSMLCKPGIIPALCWQVANEALARRKIRRFSSRIFEPQDYDAPWPFPRLSMSKSFAMELWAAGEEETDDHAQDVACFHSCTLNCGSE